MGAVLKCIYSSQQKLVHMPRSQSVSNVGGDQNLQKPLWSSSYSFSGFLLGFSWMVHDSFPLVCRASYTPSGGAMSPFPSCRWKRLLDASDQCCCHGTGCCHRQGAPNLGFIVMPMLGTTVTLKGERDHASGVEPASNVDAATLRQLFRSSRVSLFVMRFVADECDEDTW